MNKFTLARFNLYTIVRDLIYNWWVIVLALITGFVGSVCYFNVLSKHTYTSKMTVSINLSGYTSEATALSLARTVEITERLDDVFKSNAMKDVVAKNTGRAITGHISAQQIPETNLVVVSVEDASPETAYETMLAIHKNYTKVTDYVFTNVIIRTVVNPNMPGSSDRLVYSIKMGILVGVLAALGVVAIVMLISFLRDTVKSPSDIERELDAKLFGVINHVKGLNQKLPAAKRRLIISNPLVGFGFLNSFIKIAVKIESLRRTKKAQVFMLTSVTENEGKTSCSVNTALALAQNGHKVLLLDCDLKHPSVHYFFDGVKDTGSNTGLSDYIKNGGDINRYLKFDDNSGLYILDNNSAVEGSAELMSSLRFSQLITDLKQEFDFIIIDTPPYGLVADSEIVSSVCDAAILVVRQDIVNVEDINDMIQSFDRCYLAGCILNDYSTMSKKHELQSGFNNNYNRQNG